MEDKKNILRVIPVRYDTTGNPICYFGGIHLVAGAMLDDGSFLGMDKLNANGSDKAAITSIILNNLTTLTSNLNCEFGSEAVFSNDNIITIADKTYITGYICDNTTGLPVANATITISSADNSYNGTTDSLGFFKIKIIGNINYTVTVNAASYISATFTINDIKPVTTVDIGKYKIQHVPTFNVLNGFIYRNGGGAFSIPLENVTVTLYDQTTILDQTVTDNAGYYSFQNLNTAGKTLHYTFTKYPPFENPIWKTNSTNFTCSNTETKTQNFYVQQDNCYLKWTIYNPTDFRNVVGPATVPYKENILIKIYDVTQNTFVADYVLRGNPLTLYKENINDVTVLDGDHINPSPVNLTVNDIYKGVYTAQIDTVTPTNSTFGFITGNNVDHGKFQVSPYGYPTNDTTFLFYQKSGRTLQLVVGALKQTISSYDVTLLNDRGYPQHTQTFWNDLTTNPHKVFVNYSGQNDAVFFPVGEYSVKFKCIVAGVTLSNTQLITITQSDYDNGVVQSLGNLLATING